MNIGVVGLGFMGGTHLQAYRAVPSAEIVAVASSDPRKREGDLSAVSGNLDVSAEPLDFTGVAPYSTPEELFADPNIEAVDLCVPTYLHAPLANAALEARKHVLVEKPMALSAAECDSMIAAAEAAGKVLMVAQVIRYWPEYVAAREWIRDGRLGTVRSASFRRRCACPGWSGWLSERAKSGGGIFDLLIHDLDYALYLFGRPTSVSAIGTEDIVSGIDVVGTRLRYDEGPAVTVSGGWQGRGDFPFSMAFTIVGEAGTLDFHSGQTPLTYYSPDGGSESIGVQQGDGFQAELEAFVAACKTGRPPANCPPQDSALATRIALAMRASREQASTPLAP